MKLNINNVINAIQENKIKQDLIEVINDEFVIHFSPFANKIFKDKAFLFGESNPNNLDYTLNEYNKYKQHKGKGYNFAFSIKNFNEGFQPDYLLAEMGLLSYGYHDTAVMFKIRKGLYTWHKADRFNQVIFSSEDVYEDSFIYLERVPLKNAINDENGNEVFDYWRFEDSKGKYDFPEEAFGTEEAINYIKNNILLSKKIKKLGYK